MLLHTLLCCGTTLIGSTVCTSSRQLELRESLRDPARCSDCSLQQFIALDADGLPDAGHGLQYHLFVLNKLFLINVFVFCDVWRVSVPLRSWPTLAKPTLANFSVSVFWPNFLVLLLWCCCVVLLCCCLVLLCVVAPNPQKPKSYTTTRELQTRTLKGSGASNNTKIQPR